MIVNINLHSSQGCPIRIYDGYFDHAKIHIKVSNGDNPVNIKSFSCDGHAVAEQNNYGVLFQPDVFVTYEMNIDTIHKLKPLVQLFLDKDCVGQGVLSPATFLKSSCGQINASIMTATTVLVAEVTFDYVVISPWENKPLSLTSEQQTYFNGECLYFGHRGCGKTMNRSHSVLENTLESFSAAHTKGASFVELDIQITKDRIPVVFHDFAASVFSRNSKDEYEIFETAIKDLTLKQLNSLKMDFARDGAGTQYDERFSKLFPTLEQLLNDAPENLGVMLEVKYPYQDLKTGEWELEGYHSRNTVVDLILDVVMQYKGKRNVVFASFDADICLMLKYKQSRFEVMMITSGENDKYFYMDIRNRTRKIAANLSLVYNLLGISIMSDPLQDNLNDFKDLVELLKKNNKHLATWGTANSNSNFVEQQKSAGVSSVISDHLENLKIKS